MEYIVEAFSWGNDLVSPKIEKCHPASLQDARKEMDRYWENQRCFQVRVLSPVGSASACEHYLHCMKSRPNKYRELRLFFEEIVAPHGVDTILNNEKVNVLRVSDFPSVATARCLQLPADKFYYNIMGTDRREIEIRRSTVDGQPLQLASFETCIAAAALIPSGVDALLGIQDVSFYFLSDVEIEGRTAELTFDLMDVGKDFIQ
ncbi:MAG: hypothetical protein RID11_11765 [Roseovarius sp.]|jgi:hypothetical protein|uniref:hypothetical protein n=1 Tax=Roseovarius sp. TaxID=1486281 RepID=UPI0032EC8A52